MGALFGPNFFDSPSFFAFQREHSKHSLPHEAPVSFDLAPAVTNTKGGERTCMSKAIGLRSIKSPRMRIQRELELVCGIDCGRLVDRALRQAGLGDPPDDPDELRSFIYFYLKNELLKHYKDDAVATRLCEVVATALLSHTGIVRLPDSEPVERERVPSREEIRPPVRMSIPPASGPQSLAEVAYMHHHRKRR